tara:strand:- start:307 stop:1218 length:912 start_codon:yes stop_codon:yes gene_type:complete
MATEPKTTEQSDDISIAVDGGTKWTEHHENILIEWADKATCYRWLHAKSHLDYSRANTWYTIPVIVMSTLTGTANFAQDRFPENLRPAISSGIGTVNIIAGIITTIQQFLKISEYNEAHRACSISWGKFYRNIKVELAKDPKERSNVKLLLKSQKEEFDRLMEISPPISERVIRRFKTTFCNPDSPNYDAELKKPEICGALETTRHSVFKEKEALLDSATAAIFSGIAKNLDSRKRKDIIEKIIANFKNVKSRYPTAEEVMSEMDNKGSIELIASILRENVSRGTDIDTVQAEDTDIENPLTI